MSAPPNRLVDSTRPRPLPHSGRGLPRESGPGRWRDPARASSNLQGRPTRRRIASRGAAVESRLGRLGLDEAPNALDEADPCRLNVALALEEGVQLLAVSRRMWILDLRAAADHPRRNVRIHSLTLLFVCVY